MDGCENLLKDGKPKKKERSWKKPIQVTYKINGRQKKENIILDYRRRKKCVHSRMTSERKI